MKILVLSGQNDAANARHARTLGATDFIAKPCEAEGLKKLLLHALQVRAAEISEGSEAGGEQLIGASVLLEKLKNQIRQYADSPFPALIEGESGSGKEVIASSLHRMSCRKDKPWFALNCAAIAPTLVEPTLFGYSKGAFTGANANKSGYFEDAQEGTLFLDEIGELPLELQAKLLRVLENGEFQRVGETQQRTSRARVIAATNRDLRACVAARSFREDLLYRLGEFVVDVPPLRERPEDILFFMDVFLLEACAEMGRQVRGFSAAAAELLLHHPWPGNIRELKNVVRRSTLLAPGELVETGQIDFIARAGEAGADDGAGGSLKDAVHELEKRLIRQALDKTGGHKARAAELLKMSYPSLLAKTREFELGE
jgi:DNA-binding NtrC family response regulator